MYADLRSMQGERKHWHLLSPKIDSPQTKERCTVIFEEWPRSSLLDQSYLWMLPILFRQCF